MITTEAYFENINKEISRELDLATQSIYVAVAWFTDKTLFSKLLEKQKEGCKVYLIINNDEINSTSSLNYSILEKGNGFFKYIDGELMHNKFCVIDKRVVITGSYNWTNSAAYRNKENVTVTQGDFDLARRFVEQFESLSGLKKEASATINYGNLIKRLRIIIELIGLGDEEDIEYQCKRLNKEELDEDLVKIVGLVSNKQFEKALTTIEKYISSKSKLEVYVNPRISALQLEIKNLEIRIISIDDEFSDATRKVNEFNTEYYKALGELIQKIYNIKEIYFEKHRKDGAEAEDEYQQNRNDSQEFNDDKTITEEEPCFELDEDQKKDLKKMHREGAMLCHPDKVSDTLKNQSNELFQDLQEAYERQDIAKVSEILTKARSGDWSRGKENISDIKILENKRDSLDKSLKTKLNSLEELFSSDSYSEIISIKSLNNYLVETKVSLEANYSFWVEKKQ